MKSWIEISGARLAANVAAVRDRVGEQTEVLAVVKADGYGHGTEIVAPVLVDAGIRWLGVNDVEEGAQVRLALGARAARLLVMVGMEACDAEAIVTHHLTPAVWTREHVQALELAAKAAQTVVSVHVEVDTGMARQGAAPGAALSEVFDALASTKHVRCEAVMTHFAESEVASSPVTAAQMLRFEAALQQMRAAGIVPELIHAANSSAIDEGATLTWLQQLAEPLGARVMVRPGYAVYGNCLPVENGQSHLAAKLQPTLVWKTHVIGLRDVEPGATIGYGATFLASRPMRLALLPVGYADGFRRAASSGLGNGWVMIAGQRAPVVGRVSMNLTVVDVTGVAVRVGDDATLLGEGVTADDHARWAGTIGYDILCGIRAHSRLQ